MRAKNPITVFAFVLTMWSAYPAKAWYSPSHQRWINRDPVGERGGVNLHALNPNNPVTYVDPFGLNLLCVSENCKGKDLSSFTYLAEAEPPSDEDKRAGRTEGKKRLRQVPPPGQCVEVDAVYYAGGATKVSNLGAGTIDCSSGASKFKYTSCVPFGIRGDGAVWKAGDKKAPDRWPDSTIPPYQTNPPHTPEPPLNPFPWPSIPDPGPATPGRRS